MYGITKDANGNMACVGFSGENLGDDKVKYSGWFLKTDMTFTTQKASPEAKQEVRDNDLDALGMRCGLITLGLEK